MKRRGTKAEAGEPLAKWEPLGDETFFTALERLILCSSSATHEGWNNDVDVFLVTLRDFPQKSPQKLFQLMRICYSQLNVRVIDGGWEAFVNEGDLGTLMTNNISALRVAIARILLRWVELPIDTSAKMVLLPKIVSMDEAYPDVHASGLMTVLVTKMQDGIKAHQEQQRKKHSILLTGEVDGDQAKDSHLRVSSENRGKDGDAKKMRRQRAKKDRARVSAFVDFMTLHGSSKAADYLTYIDLQVMRSLDIREFVTPPTSFSEDMAIGSEAAPGLDSSSAIGALRSSLHKTKVERKEGLSTYKTSFNRVRNLLVKVVVKHSDRRARAASIRDVVSIAVRFRELNNFNGVMVVLSALHMPAVTELRLTWVTYTKMFPDNQAQFERLTSLMNPSKNYAKYRKVLEHCDRPFIPYLGITLRDLSFVEMTSATKAKNDTINYDKARAMMAIVKGVWQWRKYELNSLAQVDSEMLDIVVSAAGPCYIGTDDEDANDAVAAALAADRLRERDELSPSSTGDAASASGMESGASSTNPSRSGSRLDLNTIVSPVQMSRITSTLLYNDVQTLSRRDWNLLLTGAKKRRYSPGTMVVVEATIAPCLFHVREGNARVTQCGELVATLGPDELFGEMSVMDKYGVSLYSVVAGSQGVTVHIIELSFVAKLFAAEPELALRFFRYMATRMAHRYSNEHVSLFANAAKDSWATDALSKAFPRAKTQREADEENEMYGPASRQNSFLRVPIKRNSSDVSSNGDTSSSSRSRSESDHSDEGLIIATEPLSSRPSPKLRPSDSGVTDGGSSETPEGTISDQSQVTVEATIDPAMMLEADAPLPPAPESEACTPRSESLISPRSEQDSTPFDLHSSKSHSPALSPSLAVSPPSFNNSDVEGEIDGLNLSSLGGDVSDNDTSFTHSASATSDRDNTSDTDESETLTVDGPSSTSSRGSSTPSLNGSSDHVKGTKPRTSRKHSDRSRTASIDFGSDGGGREPRSRGSRHSRKKHRRKRTRTASSFGDGETARANGGGIGDEFANGTAGGGAHLKHLPMHDEASPSGISLRETKCQVEDNKFAGKFVLGKRDLLIKSYNCQITTQVGNYHWGTLYVSQTYLCFFSKVFNIKMKEVIDFSDVSKVHTKTHADGSTIKMDVVLSKRKKKTFLVQAEECAELVGLIEALVALGKTRSERLNVLQCDDLTYAPKDIADGKRSSPIASNSSMELQEEDWRILLEGSTLLKFKKDEVVVNEHGIDRRIYRVARGKLHVEKMHQGMAVRLYNIHEGDTFGEVSFLEGRYSNLTSVVADTAVEVYALDDYYVELLSARKPTLSARFFHYLTSTLIDKLKGRERKETPAERAAKDIGLPPFYVRLPNLIAMPINSEEMRLVFAGPTNQITSDKTDIASATAITTYPYDRPKIKPGTNILIKQRLGDPICDQYCIAYYRNRVVAALADGCNWGENVRKAASRASRTFVRYMMVRQHEFTDVARVGALMQRAFAVAHHAISNVDEEGVETVHGIGTTTLLGAVQLQLNKVANAEKMLARLARNQNIMISKDQLSDLSPKSRRKHAALSHVGSDDQLDGFKMMKASDLHFEQYVKAKWGLLLANVGDCKAFHYRAKDGAVRDVTYNNRCLSEDASDCGGRLGPYMDGNKPDLRNYKLSFYAVEDNDLIMLVSDGVHDNLDPQALGIPPSELTLGSSKSWDELSPERAEVAKTLYREVKVAELLKEHMAKHGATTLTSSLACDCLMEYSAEINKPAQDWMEEHPNKKLPSDYTRFPGKMDHSTAICWQVGNAPNLKSCVRSHEQFVSEELKKPMPMEGVIVNP
eukprot:TRINITY_DN4860_c0_g1_i2.p1 TRINITY_DN4860_c0_g1~~TRINITY_DN4860_c0_g1_i2.p1  ORF type:complete len:1810 (-),score=454.74 TRINITY_DN4860_c0_g1_i2:90-5519(-)